MAATTERALCVDQSEDPAQMLPLEEVYTPGTKTIEDVANYLGLDKKQTIKALLFTKFDHEGQEEGYVAAFVRGDRELNRVKLVNALGIPEHALEFADEEKIQEATGCVGGFTGPIGIRNCTVVIDSELALAKNLCAGACKIDHHLINVNYGRDYQGDILCDIKMIKAQDPCPICGSPVEFARGIEVGQLFKLDTKYAESMGASYKDENQEDQWIVMGCYGIGVTRTMAAIVEQHHDENGIIWPVSVAPYHAIITLVGTKDPNQIELAESIYDDLKSCGVEVLLDDREERPGVKFKDADLLGIPIRITVGRGAPDGIVEFKRRRDADKVELSVADALERTKKIICEEGKG